MAGARSKGKKRASPPPARARGVTAVPFLAPALVAAALCAPCLTLAYFWDDYWFLTFRGSGDFRSFLLPSADESFYRPVAQGLYFILLRFADPSTGLLGHLLNFLALITAVALVVLLVSRLCGLRAGVFSGLVFASFGHVPSLVAWISCNQDLFAIAFVLAAFLLRHERKNAAALACATAGLLCKEPAVAAFPILAFWDQIVGRDSRRTWLQLGAYAAVVLLWVAIHPGIHALAGRGFRSGATGYLGLESPERWGRYLLRYVMSLINLPPLGFAVKWRGDLVVPAIAALGILAATISHLSRGHGAKSPPPSVTLGRVALIAALFAVPTLLMPTLLIRHWAPYFVCIPALGLAIVLGPLLARQRPAVALVALAAFLLLGVRFRGAQAANEPVWSEPVFMDASKSIQRVRRNFHTLAPTLPRGAEIVVSAARTGARGVPGTLTKMQAPSIWYGDPSLRTVATMDRRPGAPSELLVRVTTELDVIAIDPDSHGARWTSKAPPDLADITRPLRSYARAVAAGGETERAVRILESLASVEPPALALVNRRLIASVLLAAGRRAEADSILTSTNPFPREASLALVKRVLEQPSRSESLDEAAYEAFGLSDTDPETLRWMMNEFEKDGLRAQAAWLAQRLMLIAPDDPEAAELIRKAAGDGIEPRRVPE